MKILLIAPNTNESTGRFNWACPPFGVHRIAALLRYEGHEAFVYDCNIHDNLEKLLEEKWDIIGFSVLQATLANDIKNMWLAKEKCPKALLVAGGIESTLNYQDILDHSPVKVIILAEGEMAMVELANGTKPALIEGAIVKTECEPITSEALWTYWHLIDFTKLNYEKYWEEMRKAHPEDYDKEGGDTVRLITSSHCNRNCIFCSVTQWHKFACGKVAPVASLTPERVWELVKKVKLDLPTMKSVYFVEDDFIVTKERAWKFFDLAKGSGIRFQIQTHTSKLDEDALIVHMADGGCRHITMGLENCSPRVLQTLHKPQNLERIPDIIETCKAVDIRPYLLVILFCPEITIDELWTNYERLTEWEHLGATVSLEPNMMTYRGAPLYNHRSAMLYKVVDLKNGAMRIPISLLPVDPKVRFVQKLFNEHWQEYLESKELNHGFKGATGKLMLELLRRSLEEANGRELKGLEIKKWVWNGKTVDVDGV